MNLIQWFIFPTAVGTEGGRRCANGLLAYVKETLPAAEKGPLCQKGVPDPLDSRRLPVHIQHGDDVEAHPQSGEVAALLE